MIYYNIAVNSCDSPEFDLIVDKYDSSPVFHYRDGDLIMVGFINGQSVVDVFRELVRVNTQFELRSDIVRLSYGDQFKEFIKP